jgi:hypothetical protein
MAVPTAHVNVIAFLMHSDVGTMLELPTHNTPVNAVGDGVRMIVSPTAAILYAVNKFSVSTVAVHPDAPVVLLKPLAQLEHEEAPASAEVPAMQLMHVDDDVAADVADAVPATHLVQDEAPVSE